MSYQNRRYRVVDGKLEKVWNGTNEPGWFKTKVEARAAVTPPQEPAETEEPGKTDESVETEAVDETEAVEGAEPEEPAPARRGRQATKTGRA